MRLLLTGGAGYIGSHTAVAALKAGHEVVIFDNFSNSTPDVVRAIRAAAGTGVLSLEPGDVRNQDRLRFVMMNHRFDAVIHFAGLKSVPESVARPLDYYDVNVVGSLSLLSAMREARIDRFVFSSSAAVYGEPQYLPIDEDHPLSPASPYGETKRQVEQLVTDLSASDPAFSAALLRYFNPVGSDDSGLIGETPSGTPANLMPYVCEVAAGKRDILTVYGDDYDTADGTGRRDYIHICDLAAAHLAALDWTTSQQGCRAFNIGTGASHSVLEMVAAFGRENRCDVPYRISPRRPGDVADCHASPARANRELQWSADRGIDDMCRSAWRWVASRQ